MRRITLGFMSVMGLIAVGVASAPAPQTATLAVENMTCGTQAGFPSKVVSKP